MSVGRRARFEARTSHFSARSRRKAPPQMQLERLSHALDYAEPGVDCSIPGTLALSGMRVR